MSCAEPLSDSKGESLTPAVLLILWILITLSLWSFAFWHIPEATPEWLLRAQAACFGINENGLPDTAGWFILVLAPLSFLFAALVAYGREIFSGLRYFLRPLTGRAFAVILLLCVLAQTVWVFKRISDGQAVAEASYLSDELRDLPAHYPKLNQPAKSFALMNQYGKRLGLSELKGRPLVLTFAFAHCQTVCPAIVQQVLTAARKFPPETLSVLVVTLDPWRDTPSALPTLAKQWDLGESQYVLSGNVDEVLSVHKDYHMAIQRDERSGDIVHPSPSYVIDAEGEIVYAFNNASVTWLSQAIENVLASAKESQE